LNDSDQKLYYTSLPQGTLGRQNQGRYCINSVTTSFQSLLRILEGHEKEIRNKSCKE